MKGNEGKIDLTHEETDGDSTSHSSLSSSSENNNASNKGSRSKNSIKGKENMGATRSGELVPTTPSHPWERHSMQSQVEWGMIGII